MIEFSTVGSSDPRSPVVVLLHGFGRTQDDCVPFARALGAPATFLFPAGELSVPRDTDGTPARAWWRIDTVARAEAIQEGPRDLSHLHPEGVDAARARLADFLDDVQATFAPSPLILGGFSQGAMLSLDFMLHDQPRLDGLVLLSAARIRASEWEPLLGRVRGIPVYQSHGHHDPDLSYAAAQRLRDRLKENGALVEWHDFEGAHETPLIVWRTVKRFIQRVVASEPRA
jgi:phospholipase/carboxylesterase